MNSRVMDDSDTASAKVFNIGELVEQILLHLPTINDLVLAQRVSRTFRSATLASLNLGRKMHLVVGKDDKLALAPLRCRSLEEYTVFPAGYYLPLGEVPDAYVSISLRLLPPQNYTGNASWTKMFITQPPLKSVEVRLMYKRAEPKLLKISRRVIIASEEGIKFGDIVKAAYKLVPAGARGKLVAMCKGKLGQSVVD